LKKNMLNQIDVYLVTDSELSRNGTLSDVEQAVKAGCKIIQYREKNKGTGDMIREAFLIKDVCGDRAIFIVNDRIDIALAVGSDGVHIGQDDMPFDLARSLLGEGKIIGLTVHTVEEAVQAEYLGADYIGLSPIFSTSTKKDAGAACGIPMIEKVRNNVQLPIVAIGGITGENVSDVIKAGADAAVAISAVVSAFDVNKEIGDFISKINRAKK